MQQFMFGLKSSFGTAQYPKSWSNKMKFNKDYIVLPMYNNTRETSICLLQITPQSPIFVESCLNNVIDN